MIGTLKADALGKSARCIAVVAAMCQSGLSSNPMHAAPVTYTINASGSGSLGGTAFSNSNFVITAEADTNDVVPFASGFGFLVANSSLNIAVAGIGNGDLLNANQSVSNQDNGSAGFGDNDKALAILFVSNTIFRGFDLKSSIGPIPGSPAFNTRESFPTTAGDFVLTGVSTASFTAIVIPEPTTLTLVCFGLSLIVLRRRKLPLYS